MTDYRLRRGINSDIDGLGNAYWFIYQRLKNQVPGMSMFSDKALVTIAEEAAKALFEEVAP